MMALPELAQQLLEREDDVSAVAASYFESRMRSTSAGRQPTLGPGRCAQAQEMPIHAEGYSAGEMKHGPIALVEPSHSPAIAVMATFTTR